MAEKKIVYRLDVDTSGTRTDQARASLEALKKKILETEAEIAKLRKGVRDGSKTIEETAGPISQLETRLKGLRVGYQEVQRDSIGVMGFTDTLSKKFAEAVNPIQQLLGALGPMGGQLGTLAGTVGTISSALDAFFSSGKKGSDAMDGMGKAAANAGAASAKAEKQVDGLADSVDDVAKPATDGGKGLDVLAKSADHVADESKGAVTGIESIVDAADDLAPSTKAGGAGLDELSKFTKGAESSAKGASGGITGLIGGINPLAIVAGLAAGAVVVFGKELFALSSHIEQVERKAKILYGDAFPKIQQAANDSANDLGLTTTQYIELASAQQVVFSSLGLTAGQMADLTPQLLEAADNLADFTGNGMETADAMNILTSAVRGNMKGLNELGIAIKRKPEELKAMSDEIFNQGGVTKDQADALASLRLVMEGVGKQAAQFGAGQKTMADQADKTTASIAEQKERLARGLAPAFQFLSAAIGDAAGALADFLNVPPVKTGVEEAAAEQEKYNAQLDKQVTAEAIVKGSTEKLIETRDRLTASMEAYRQKGFTEDASANEKTIRAIQSELSLRGEETAAAEAAAKKKKEEEDAVARLGLTYEALTKKLADLNDQRKVIQDGDKAAIAASNKEIADTEKRLQVFDRQKKGLSELAQAQKQFAASQATLAIQYELTTAKINAALQDGLIDQQTAQKMLLEAEVANIASRLQAKEQLALADKKLTDQEKANILEINAALGNAKKAVEDYGRAIEQNVKDKEAKIKIELEMAEASFDKVIADAVSLDTMTASFDEVFRTTATNFGDDLKEQMKAAAQDGSFDTFVATIDVSGTKEEIAEQQKLISDTRRIYDQFTQETKRNKLQLIQREDSIALEEAKTKLEEVRAKLAALKAANNTKIEAGIDIPQADIDKVNELQTDLADLEGKIVTATVKVAKDDKALEEVQGDLNAIEKTGTPDEPKGKDQADSLLKTLGLDEATTSFAIEAAQELVDQISSVLLAGQQARIDRALERETNAAQAQYDAQLSGLNAALSSGAISQAEFDARAIEAQKQVDAAKLAAQKKAFEDKKRLDRAQAWINFGMELSSLAMSSAPLGVGAPLFYGVQAGLAAVRLAANLSTINSQKFEQGGQVTPESSMDASAGGFLKGPSHAQGGIKAMVAGQRMVELEGNEVVINARSSKAFAPLLSRLNAHNGWGRAFHYGGVVSTPIPSFSSPTFARGGSVPKFEMGGSLVPSDNVIANQEQLRRAITPVESTSPISSRVQQQQQPQFLRLTDLDHYQNEGEARLARVTY